MSAEGVESKGRASLSRSGFLPDSGSEVSPSRGSFLCGAGDREREKWWHQEVIHG